MPHDDPTPQLDNPYAAPQADVSVESARSDDPQIAQFRAFVGPRADVYLAKWYHLLWGGSGGAGFNWPAFLWSGLWFPFRKMYQVTAVFYGLMIATTIGEEVMFVLVANQEVPPFLDTAVGLVAAFVCGFGANRWYLNHARRTIAEVRALGLQDSACLVEISRRGGTSMLAAIGLFVCFIMVMVVIGTFFQFLYTNLEAAP